MGERSEGGHGIARRPLLKGLAAGVVAAAFGGLGAGERAGAAELAAAAPSALGTPGNGKIRGVNLGAWLVLEKWMAPSVFEGASAGDEYGLCRELGPKAAAARLKKHHDTWITDDDFKWLAARGINAVRVPVGYWTLGGDTPFVAAPETLDRAFAQAAAHGIAVLIDLHGAPGSQNGWDHSGRSGEIGWYKDPRNIAKTLDAVERLAERYADRPNLLGIELLNEPRWDIPIDVLKQYYQDGYRRVRKHIPAEKGVVMVHDGFRPMEWKGFMPAPEYQNVILDTHIYQCYTDEDHKREAGGHIAVAADRRKQIDQMAAEELPTVVGEWSSALDPHSYGTMSPFEIDAAKRGYVAAQLTSYERSRGWFYWSYKLEKPSDWSFRECVERGWMPGSFADGAERQVRR